MNKTRKGYTKKKLVQDTFKELGFICGDVEKSGRFVKEKDLFGIADLVAAYNGRVIFIQITCNKAHTHTLYKEFTKKHKLHVIQIIVNDGLSFELRDYYYKLKFKLNNTAELKEKLKDYLEAFQ